MKAFLLPSLLSPCALTANAQDPYADCRERWLRIAEESKPQLHETIVKPKTIVKAVKDPNAYQGWRYEPATGLDSLQFRAVSSAGEVKTLLSDDCPQMIRDINRVGIETLRESCKRYRLSSKAN